MRFLKMVTALIAVSVASPASASVMTFFTLDPPAKYNKITPKNPVKVYRLSMKDLQWSCGNKLAPLQIIYGCAKIFDDRCTIFIPKTPVVNIGFPLPPIPIITPEMILNHEMAHCAGWPRNHPRH